MTPSRTLPMACLLLLSVIIAPTGAAQENDDKQSLGDDLKALQGVWQSTPDARKQLKIMFMDDKVGFEIADPKGKPGEGVQGFLALSAAQHKEAKGKRYFRVEVAKDYVRQVDYRFQKDGLVFGLDGAEFKVERANTRASTNPMAKRLMGTWKVTGIEQQGRKGRAKDSGLEAIVFTEDRYILKAPDGKELLNSFYRVNAAGEPESMDWYGMKPTFVIPLIYEVKGDEIRLAHPPFARAAKVAKRPISFETKGSDTMLIRAERSR